MEQLRNTTTNRPERPLSFPTPDGLEREHALLKVALLLVVVGPVGIHV